MSAAELRVNADFDEVVVIDTNKEDWVPSPSNGVDRIMLDRLGGEVARATSIVRFAPNSEFPTHSHDGGEEFLVLDGVFSDEHGDFGPGSYMRNPIGTSHTPYTVDGCTILVKLWQFQEGDSESVKIKTKDTDFFQGMVEGLTVLPLHNFGTENTALVRWAPDTYFNPHTHFGGEEIFVVEGTFEDEHGTYPSGTWIRSPHLSKHKPFSKEGCLILVKTGHLLEENGTLGTPSDR